MVFETNRWNIAGRFQAKGKEQELDSFIDAIGCINRRNASAAWLIFKMSNGVVSPKSFCSDKRQTLMEHQQQTADHDKLIEIAIDQTRVHGCWNFDDGQLDQSENCSRTAEFKETMKTMISQLNEALASALCSVFASKLNDRVNIFTRQVLQNSLRDGFVLCWSNCPDANAEFTLEELRHWAVRSFIYLHKEWELATSSHCRPELVSESCDADVLDLLKGSRPTVCFAAGWVLF